VGILQRKEKTTKRTKKKTTLNAETPSMNLTKIKKKARLRIMHNWNSCNP